MTNNVQQSPAGSLHMGVLQIHIQKSKISVQPRANHNDELLENGCEPILWYPLVNRMEICLLYTVGTRTKLNNRVLVVNHYLLEWIPVFVSTDKRLQNFGSQTESQIANAVQRSHSRLNGSIHSCKIRGCQDDSPWCRSRNGNILYQARTRSSHSNEGPFHTQLDKLRNFHKGQI